MENGGGAPRILDQLNDPGVLSPITVVKEEG
jgi:hypothetical protein